MCRLRCLPCRNDMLSYKVFGSGLSTLATTAICKDVATSVSAAGTTQVTATELTAADNEVTTVAANSGVALSSLGSAGDGQSVYNGGANPLNVYPPSGMSINQLSANVPIILPVSTGALFKFISSSRIIGVLSA